MKSEDGGQLVAVFVSELGYFNTAGCASDREQRFLTDATHTFQKSVLNIPYFFSRESAFIIIFLPLQQSDQSKFLNHYMAPVRPVWE
ncbi:hypothetical protein EDC63_13032 [Sulfurirhabdus autotrophica]|uniref:Uncharacterized protein n=1 Tax=Sulfurirhabdus autotrophica TaxID=1706046 RepID=A0A4V2W0U8_9PROT|nr:hypothetical protein EDC63_13032 [Sulfurirhabdus autotrophica]